MFGPSVPLPRTGLKYRLPVRRPDGGYSRRIGVLSIWMAGTQPPAGSVAIAVTAPTKATDVPLPMTHPQVDAEADWLRRVTRLRVANWLVGVCHRLVESLAPAVRCASVS
jgi:hypothetical protein